MSMDGAPTFYEVPLSASRYYISIFAATKASYRLTVLADIGAMPRPGLNGKPLFDGQVIDRPIEFNYTHLFYYENYNVTTMNQKKEHRQLIFSLEPCEGVVYMFVRKTRPCWPNPYSCIKLTEGEG